MPSPSALLLGLVVGITDGDTLTLLTPEHQKVKVRFAEIDAPEHSQAFGKRAKQALSDLCFQKQAEVRLTGAEHRDRPIGYVTCDGTEVNPAMMKAGMAWAHPKYAKDPALYTLQDEARTAKRGLWIDPSPIPPWVFRKAQRAK
jgi:micrococcal nuclease